jgi:hypothetical protein
MFEADYTFSRDLSNVILMSFSVSFQRKHESRPSYITLCLTFFLSLKINALGTTSTFWVPSVCYTGGFSKI